MPIKDREQRLAYHREYNKRYYAGKTESEKVRIAERKAELVEWVREQKIGKSCAECGFDDPRALDYHHTGDKLFSIASAVRRGGYGKQKILDEMAKCVILCANCHRIHHSGIV